MAIKSLLISIFVVLTMNLVGAQELVYAKDTRSTFDRARTLAYEATIIQPNPYYLVY